MSTEIALLRVLLRLSRRRAPATVSDLVARVGADASDVRRALGALARAQLVQRADDTVRLSLAGLAVAVASKQPSSSARTARGAPRIRGDETSAAPRSGSVIPLVRRGRGRRAA